MPPERVDWSRGLSSQLDDDRDPDVPPPPPQRPPPGTYIPIQIYENKPKATQSAIR